MKRGQITRLFAAMAAAGAISIGQNGVSAPLCSQVFVSHQEKAIPIDETVTEWYTTVEMGYHEKWIAKDLDTGIRKVEVVLSDTDPSKSIRLHNVALSPDAKDDSSSYYALMSRNQLTKVVDATLYPINSTQNLSAFVDKNFQLVWDVYLKKHVVTPKEIEDFKKTESELAPQRKVTFVTKSQSGKLLAVLRLYDGSKFPTVFLTDPHHIESPITDPRLPIERRYPELKLRGKTQYIFEAGRLAKSEEVQDILPYEFYNIGSYLFSKFSSQGKAPPEYWKAGRVYIEITGEHLEYYMKSFRDGGMGFHLFAKAPDGKKMLRVAEGTNFAAVKDVRTKPESKFVLYLGINDFVNQFGHDEPSS